MAPTGITRRPALHGRLLQIRQSGPRPEGRLLRQPALEGLTRSAWMDSPRKVGRNKFRQGKAAAAVVRKSYFQNPPLMLNTLSSVSVWESRIQYLCDPQWFRDTASPHLGRLPPLQAAAAAVPATRRRRRRRPSPEFLRPTFEENPSALILSGLLVQADDGVSLPVVDLIDESTAAYREDPVFL
ncbi:hypothetical protein F511_23837 [Dorcoceras hygrometricum]|uniref:Uncharacterized protein n=1 Tax=Dorcoceras hygrometricum TaxID=472368 RepID=A0A2Z7BED7_9LAMI|nr:hypothetical protein F511_23837 [Dorcoceras hygrometricum]